MHSKFSQTYLRKHLQHAVRENSSLNPLLPFNFQCLAFQVCRSHKVLVKGKVPGEKSLLTRWNNLFTTKNAHQSKCNIRRSCDVLMSQDDHFMPHLPHPDYVFVIVLSMIRQFLEISQSPQGSILKRLLDKNQPLDPNSNKSGSKTLLALGANKKFTSMFHWLFLFDVQLNILPDPRRRFCTLAADAFPEGKQNWNKRKEEGSKFIFSSSPHRRKKGKSFRLVLFYNDQHQFSRENIDTKMAMLIDNSDGKTCLTGDEILPRNYPERKAVSQVYLSLLVTPWICDLTDWPSFLWSASYRWPEQKNLFFTSSLALNLRDTILTAWTPRSNQICHADFSTCRLRVHRPYQGVRSHIRGQAARPNWPN